MPKAKTFVQIRVGPDEKVTSKHINAVQTNVAQALTSVAQALTPNKIVANLVPSGINMLNIGCSASQGWHVARTYGTGSAPVVWDVQQANPSPNLQLWLMASATGTVQIQVM